MKIEITKSGMWAIALILCVYFMQAYGWSLTALGMAYLAMVAVFISNLVYKASK